MRSVWDTSVRFLRAGLGAGRIVTVDRAELDLPRGKRIPGREATYIYRCDRCLRCVTPIATLDVANRTCYYCPVHQPD